MNLEEAMKLHNVAPKPRVVVIRALPGSGKTTMSRRAPDKYADIDEVIHRALGLKASKATSELIMGSEDLRKRLLVALEAEASDGKIILTNINLGHITGQEADVHVTYGDRYVDHLRGTDRDDLFAAFSEEELRGWAVEPKKRPKKTVLLEPGQYLSDLLDRSDLEVFPS